MLFLMLLFACGNNNEKHGLPFVKAVPGSDYYCGELKIWLRFSDTAGEVSGYFFADSGRAETTIFPFIIKWMKDSWTVWYKNDSLISVSFNVKEESDTSFVINAETRDYHFLLTNEPAFPKQTGRYRDVISDSVEMKTVNFGTARGYYTSKIVNDICEDKYIDILYDVSKTLAKNILMEDLPLEMDIYQPSGDSCLFRPLILLIHGGAFMLGDKSSPTMKELADYFVRRGYVVASVNYRMGFWMVPGSYYFLERAIYRATQDVRASLRYLSAHAKDFGIDTSRIYTCGNSAGGFLALNAAMMNDDNYFPSHKGDVYFLLDDLGCLDCSTNRLNDRFHVKAVVNMWGALTHIRMLTGRPDIPLLCFHGSDDKIIPTCHEYPFLNISRELTAFFTEKVFGSEIIYRYSRVTKTPVKLKLFEGMGHDPHINDDGTFNASFDTIKWMTRDFLYPFNAAAEITVKGNFKLRKEDAIPEYLCEVSDSEAEVFWKARGGRILRDMERPEKIKVLWFKGQKHELFVALRNRNHSVTFKSYPVVLN
jgi:acetyl esterase/lipase